ncbi:MAG: hypothetical protein AB4372_18050 [Xenococcus sp. (in: cyanobacteria)]
MSSIIVIKALETDGIEMGVLEDGTPFLTGRGLATVCGISPGTLNDWGEETPKIGDRLRMGKMAKLLADQGFEGDRFFDKVDFKGQQSNAYNDAVCMAFLEYYAFEAGEKRCTEEAKNNYRVLARKTLREFIYRTVGYDPRDIVPISWRHFHDRLVLNSVPLGYFSVFKETADIVVSAIREGLIVDSGTVPDISVGKTWSTYWKNQNLASIYGARIQYPHEYPDYFPQAEANGSIYAYLYPIDALGLFRKWLNTEYLPTKFPSYLKRKVKQGAIPASSVELLLKAVTPFELPEQK